ncbi:efflux RND transporter periplasmic adaptor subunit [bacterium]|nr:efflux RND transporter periplasmic adaptor subunit [bacterium]
MKKIAIWATIIILSAVGIRAAIKDIQEHIKAKEQAMAAIPVVQLKEVQSVEAAKSIELPGRIESPDKVDLVARIDGYLQKKHFKEGDFVKKGQILFTIEKTQYLNALNKAKADLQSAKANLYKAENDYKRGAELVKKDYISKSTYDGLYANMLSAKASVKAANAALSEAQRNYGYTSIKSPVDGKIGSLQIQEGNYVTVASGTLATVTKTNPIYVKYSVDSKQFDILKNNDFLPKKGMQDIKIEVILSNGKTYPLKGTQDFLDNQISTTTGTIDFRATIDNPENDLIPGDFVKVKVYSNKKNTYNVIEQDLTLQDARGRYVYTVNSDNQAIPVYFTDDGQYEHYWIIKEGINKGDKYVSTNITKLMPNMTVKISDNTENAENSEVKENK